MKYSWYQFLFGLSRLRGHSETEIIMTSSGIKPATFRFVAQGLNQLRKANILHGSLHNEMSKFSKLYHIFYYIVLDIRLFIAYKNPVLAWQITRCASLMKVNVSVLLEVYSLPKLEIVWNT